MKRFVFFGLFLLCFLSALFIENSEFQKDLIYKDANELLAGKLQEKAELQDEFLHHPDLLRVIETFDVKSKLYTSLRAKDISVFAYKHDCLIFWSDNLIKPDNFEINSKPTPKILENRNGWYQVLSLQKKDLKIFAYYQFYKRYPLNNEYFINAFNENLDLDELQLLQAETDDTRELHQYVEHSKLPQVSQDSYTGKKLRQMVEYIYSLSFIFFLIFCFYHAGRRTTFDAREFMIWIASYVIGFNGLSFFNLILKHKVDNPLFRPELAAYSDFIPSLGHCILLSMAILGVMVVLHQTMSYRKFSDQIFGAFSYAVVSILHWSLNFLIVLIILPKFVLNSRIYYDFKTLANVNENTLIGMFNVFIFFLLIVLMNRILAPIVQNKQKRKMFWLIHSSVALIFIFMAYFLFRENGFLLLCFAAYGVVMPFYLLFLQKLYFRHIMATALITAALFSVQFEQLNSFKEKEHRKLFANRLITKEDIELEYKLLNIEREMIRESAIDSFFYYEKNDYHELELNYKFTFFNNFIKNYDISIMRYDDKGNDVTPNKLTFSYVNTLYNQSTNKSISNYFLYIKDLHYLGGYLAKYEICPGEHNLGYVFLLLTPKLKSDQYTLDYFFSNIDYSHLNDNRYSYAIYQKGELVRGLGAYPYKLNDQDEYRHMEDETFIEKAGYSQLLKKVDQNTFVIVALKAATWNQIFTVFTFILLCFTTILVTVILLIYIFTFIISLLSFHPFFIKLLGVITKYLRVINVNKLYLETKIRLSFLLMSVLICSVVVYFTVQNVNKSFKEKQNESLDKKMAQIVGELELGIRKTDEHPIKNLIKQLANIHEVDINMYYKDGTLYQTANNRIFYEGWFSPYIHPNAHYELIGNKQYSLKQYEKLGLLKYQSYYNAIFNENRNLIGYVHLPYFSKSMDLKNEFSSYLGSLLNMSTLLLMISLLIASYFGRSLVRPLNLMIESLTRIKVGAQNKAINWSRNDEIGQLVDQYNIMIKELEISTEKLAKSEREGAWKEMAKQVAHEIKNPLTPMKLHLQHLQMAIDRNDPQINEKMKGISQILIDQIDHLSLMAEEFSSFAKMPLAVPQACNIHQILNASILLFSSQNNVEIDYHYNQEALEVFVDKDQIQRVFTNILKNAVQAASEDRPCKISVDVRNDKQIVIISFKDNGKGIEDELKEKIFQPNFSTKNSGMGLGLAICKKIIEQVEGSITFESEINKGSTFNVILPIHQSD